MKKFQLSLLAAIACTLVTKGQVSHLVISQVYGAGGNSGATYNRDFVELFNPAATPVSLNGYSLQYTAATGTTWTSRALSGTIAANSYFLVQMTTSGTTGAPLPAPDLVVTSTDMSGTAGKIALVNVTTALSGACPATATIVDFVGYGSTANCWEGTAAAPAPGANSNSVSRGNNGCTDNDNNAADFVSGVANPRNSTSTVNVCPIVNTITTGTISSPPFCVDASLSATGSVAYSSSGSFNGFFTAWLSDPSGNFASPLNIGSAPVNGSNPSGTVNIAIPAGTVGGTAYKIRIDASNPPTTGLPSVAFEIVNGIKNINALTIAQGQSNANVSWLNPLSCFDETMVVVKQGAPVMGTPSGNGSSYTADPVFTGTGTLFDGGKVVYKGQGSTVNVTALATGGDYYFKLFTRFGNSWSSGVEMHIPSLDVVTHLVISQFYGGGGNSGALFTNDFVELFNPTNSSISLTGYSLQYASATGNNWSSNKMDLTGNVAAHSYFLVKLAGGANGAALPPADLTGTINMGASAGKLALVNSTTALTSNCPPASAYVDLVGYGSADCNEGGVNAAATNNTTALARQNGGCTDTDNNGSDFLTSTPSPRNSVSPVNNCPLSGGPLPVRFSFFKAIEKSNNIQLSWTNETEENIEVYSVERSPDSRTFTAIGQLKAKKNNQTKASYVYSDQVPLKGNNYYRIGAFELNGKKVYSSIVRINTSSSGTGLTIFPNPVKGNELVIQVNGLPKGSHTINIYNTAGQAMAAKTILHPGGAFSETISIRHLKTGLYCLRVSGGLQLQKQFLVD